MLEGNPSRDDSYQWIVAILLLSKVNVEVWKKSDVGGSVVVERKLYIV